jgi:hypothetical protein
MRFRSVWVQRLPLFAQVIAIFEKELETIDVFRPFLPAPLGPTNPIQRREFCLEVAFSA